MRFYLFVICLLLASLSSALSLRPDYPGRYTVQRGDTLWSISSKYLKNPWEWKALWHSNPQIQNPDKLYPGAVLSLEFYQNIPYIRVLSNGTVKLSPNIRMTGVDEAVPPIPLDDIKPFLNESLILDADVVSRAPYVVALMGERMLGGQGDEVYVKGLHPSKNLPKGETIGYSVFRGGRNYFDPITKDLLGYRADLVGFGELQAGGDPATLLLTSINAGVKIGDGVLINNHPEFNLFFEPQTPAVSIKGFILELPVSMPEGSTQSAVGGVIVISLGENKGITPGDVLAIYGKQRIVNDPKNHMKPIKLPLERLGEAMVFRTFTKTSYALIVRSIRPINKMDSVRNP